MSSIKKQDTEIIVKTLYIIRHCKAAGQEPEASLTPEGREQAEVLAEFLSGKGIQRIITSPYARARQSITPLASRENIPLITDDRLAERVLGAGDLGNWQELLRASFENLDLCLKGGESSRTAMQRGVAAIDDILENRDADCVAIVSHGNLMTLLLKHFDERIGFETWNSLTNPDVYRVLWEDGRRRVERVWE